MTSDDASTRGSSRRRSLVALGLLIAVLAVVTAAMTLSWPRNPAFHATDITGSPWGNDFRLQDADGRTRTLADFHGKALLLFFGFTQCPDVCPTALSRAAEVKRRLGPDAARVQVVFVTLDPERDSAEIMQAYTRAFDPSFVGLRTTADATASVAAEFRIFYRKVPTGSSYTLDHTAVTYAFDPAGRLRLAIGPAESVDEMTGDVKRLLTDAS